VFFGSLGPNKRGRVGKKKLEKQREKKKWFDY
jgi:hypothetical protein